MTRIRLISPSNQFKQCLDFVLEFLNNSIEWNDIRKNINTNSIYDVDIFNITHIEKKYLKYLTSVLRFEKNKKKRTILICREEHFIILKAFFQDQDTCIIHDRVSLLEFKKTINMRNAINKERVLSNKELVIFNLLMQGNNIIQISKKKI